SAMAWSNWAGSRRPPRNAWRNCCGWRLLRDCGVSRRTAKEPPNTEQERTDVMTDRRGVVAKRAENLMPGIPYVRGWAQARRGAGALAAQLTALGLEPDFPGLTADVNVSGDGLVRL